MFEINLKIPAKALLFGEYGVLYGGKALVCTLPEIFFEIEIRIDKSNVSDNPSCHSREFFSQILLPWEKFIKGHKIVIKINKSFEPSLGLGSSSAIISAISYALYCFVKGKLPNLNDKFLWKKIRESLKNSQGISSGYDVGAQLASLLNESTETLFWLYQNRKKSNIPIIQAMKLNKNLISQMGCFIKTHIYSNTKKTLEDFSKRKDIEKNFFASEHAKIANVFLRKKSIPSLKKCMSLSLEIAKKQNIVTSDPLTIFLAEKNIPFKTMGSGCGDSIWACIQKEDLLKNGVVKPQDIVFSF